MDSYIAFAGTREEWAVRVLEVLTRELAHVGIAMVGDRTVRVALTPLRGDRLGQCRSSNGSTDGKVNFIAVCTSEAEPRDLVHTLLHELLHAFDDCNSGHRGRWNRWAAAIGMQRCGHELGPVGTGMVETALREVGIPAQHVTSVRGRVAAIGESSQVRLACPECGLTVHMPRGPFEQGAAVLCAEHSTPMLHAAPKKRVALRSKAAA